MISPSTVNAYLVAFVELPPMNLESTKSSASALYNDQRDN